MKNKKKFLSPENTGISLDDIVTESQSQWCALNIHPWKQYTPTPEEEAKWAIRKKEIDELTKNMDIAHAAIIEFERTTTEFKYDTWYELPCPCCKEGKLRFGRSGYNGHLHAYCTNKCVDWME